MDLRERTPGEIARAFPALALRAVLRTSKIVPDDFVELGVRTDSSNGPFIKKPTAWVGSFMDGAPGEIRTPDHLVRSQVLYPAELRALILDYSRFEFTTVSILQSSHVERRDCKTLPVFCPCGASRWLSKFIPDEFVKLPTTWF